MRMIWDSGSLQTRQFARREISLPARLTVHPDHAEQLRLAFADQHGRVRLVDVSEGGLGITSSLLLPRAARLLVHVEVGRAGAGAPPQEIVLRGIVRRCVMTNVKPTYQIGMQYLDTEPAEIRALLEKCEQAAAAADGGKGHAG